MNIINRRRYPRYETEFEARIYTADLNLPVTVVDISDEGIDIISEEPIETDSKIFISIFPMNKDPILGTPVWSSHIENGSKYYYRIGVNTEKLTLENAKAIGFPKRSELVSKILSQI
jgi:hypothetical protein